MNDLKVIERQGIRVLTTAQIAECYETESKIIHDNFANNKKRFEEGKDYICLKGAELKKFKNLPENIGVVDKRSPALYLWTERGCLLIAKSLNTDKAWEVYSELVETYFRAKKAESALKDLSPQLQLMIRFETEQKAMRQDIDDNSHRLDVIEKKLKADPKATQRIKAEPKDWSEREKDYLRNAYALGQTDTEIAAAMGRTASSIRSKRYALNLTGEDRSKKHWNKREVKKLVKLTEEGFSSYDIAKMLGRSVQSIHYKRAKLRKKV